MPCVFNKSGGCLLGKPFLSNELSPCEDEEVCEDRIDKEDNFELEDESE